MLKRLILGLSLFPLMVAEVSASATQTLDKIPFKADDSGVGISVQKLILVFLLVALLAYFLIYGLKIYYNKKYDAKNPGDNLIKMAQRKYLTRNLSIICLQVNDTLFTLAQTQNQLVILEKKKISENEKEGSTESISDS